MIKERKITTALVFGISTFFCLVVLFVDVLVSNGEIISSFFFLDTRDTGMDFFNSIAIVKDRTPYSYSNSIYPPLASLIFYIIYCMVPMGYSDQWRQTSMGIVGSRGTDLDPRSWQTTMLAFLLFIIVVTLLIFLLSKKILIDAEYSALVSWCVVFSYGCLMGVERGNIILLSLAFLLMFFTLYKSENRIYQEVGLICLAISAGIKLYPAIFGLILIFEKEYKKAIRSVIYGIIFLFAPFFVFGGTAVIGPFFHRVFAFGGISSGAAGEVALGGYGFNGFFKTAVYVLSAVGKGDFVNWYAQVSWLETSAKLLFCLAGIYVGWCAKEKWERVLALTMILFLVLPLGGYGIVFAIPMLLFFLYENQDCKMLLCSRGRNLVFLCMLLLVEPVPIFGNVILYEQVISIRELIYQIVPTVLYGYIIFEFVKYMKLAWGSVISKVMRVVILISVTVTMLFSGTVQGEEKLEEYIVSENAVFDSRLIHYEVDEAGVQDEMLRVTGWCILEGDEQHYNLKQPKRLLLKDMRSNKYYEMTTDINMRQDVTDSLVKDGVNYDYSGFTATMATEKLDVSYPYGLFISYRNANREYLVSTGYVWDGKNINQSKDIP